MRLVNHPFHRSDRDEGDRQMCPQWLTWALPLTLTWRSLVQEAAREQWEAKGKVREDFPKVPTDKDTDMHDSPWIRAGGRWKLPDAAIAFPKA
jgi:hypothetical protein